MPAVVHSLPVACGPSADRGVPVPSGRGRLWRSRPPHTLFEVADTDAAVARATAAGGSCTSPPEDFVYGRIATLNDPFGAEFSVGSRPKDQQAEAGQSVG